MLDLLLFIINFHFLGYYLNKKCGQPPVQDLTPAPRDPTLMPQDPIPVPQDPTPIS